MPAIGMSGQFKQVMLDQDGEKVHVTGTFDPGDDDIHKAKVLFLIVQGDGGKETVILEGEAPWVRTQGDWSIWVDNKGVFPKSDDTEGADHAASDNAEADTEGADHAASDNAEAKLEFKEKQEERMVRGIALAIAIKPAKPATQLEPEFPGKFNAPQIEALTWCVELALRQEGRPVTAPNGS